MHNINFIRENATAFDNSMKQRGEIPCAKKIIKIDEEKRNTQTILQNILAERNKLSKEIGLLKSQKKDADKIIAKVEKLKEEASTLKELEKIKEEELAAILSRLPNIPSESTPQGKNEEDNLFYREWGSKPSFKFKPKNILK